MKIKNLPLRQIDPATLEGGGGQGGDGNQGSGGGGPVGSGGQGGLGGQGGPGNSAPQGDVITIPVEQEPDEQHGIDPDLLKDPRVQAAIEAARQQEKDKLYGRLNSHEEKLAEIERERQERLAEEAKAREAAEEAARKAAEEEMSVRELLTTKEQEWKSNFQSLEQQIEEERAVFAMERQYQEMQAYRAQVLQANSDDIMPELADLVRGNTKEEIDASVDEIKERSLRIVQQVQQQTQAMRQQQRGAAPTGAPPVGPLENESAHKTFSPDDIRAMGLDEYSKVRDRLLQSVSERSRTRGIYGQ